MGWSIRRFLPRSRRRRWLLGIVVGVGLLLLLAPRLAAPYVQAKLQAMIASKIDAELQMGSLAYVPPFGVSVRDAKLIAHDPTKGGRQFEVLKVAKLELPGQAAVWQGAAGHPA